MRKMYPCLLALGGVLATATAAMAQSEAGVGGVVRNDAGQPIPGATVFLKGTLIGTGTNRDGQFSLPADFSNGPVTISISFVGYESRELTLSKPTPDVVVTLNEAVTLNEVVVAASRVEESLQQAPVTVEKVGAAQILRLPPPDALASLNQFKAIDVNTTSMVMSSLSTRGFNSPKSERVIQLVDYFDTQSPSLNINSGNLTGIPELDIASIEVIHGPASALYGANAFNGVVLLNSKDPFVTEGLTARVRGGQRSYFDGQLRYAQKIGKRFAFKLVGSYLTADDWVASNYEAASLRVTPTNNAAGSPLGYDAVNRYGDVGNTFSAAQPFPTGVSPELVGKTVFMPGFTEQTLLGKDDKAQAFKVVPTVSYLLTDKIKATVAASINRGTASYQSSSRYRLRDFGTNQYRGELRGERWFLRGSSTQDFGNDSYDLGFLGAFLQNSPVTEGSSTTYAQQYFGTYNLAYKQARAAGASMEQAQVQAQTAANNNPNGLDPSTTRFGQLRSAIIADNTPGRGARLNPSSLLNEGNAQYDFRFGEKTNLILGASYRKFRLGSDGKFFSDDNQRIQNHEMGAYTQLSHQMLDDRLKLALAARLDLFKNFDPAVSPRASVVYSAGENRQHSFRASYGRAFRSPTQLDQYIRLDVGPVLLLGNVGSGFQGFALPSGTTGPLTPIDIAALKLERLSTYEVGYRGTLSGKLYVDLNYFRSQYNDFIGAQRFLGNPDGTRGTQRVLQVWTNASQEVHTQGASAGLSYNIVKPLTVAANYSLNVLDRSRIADANFQTFFNTPKHKFNVGASGTAGALSYSVNYRWAQGHLYETPFAVGTLADYSSLDAFVGYSFPKLATTLQAGGSNLAGSTNVQIYGGPNIGRLAYLGLLVDIK
ncbi:TonB-dependent receptor [Hymenobacter gummosus]|uniref:TonB-dependent receptor n=1 Tax=Hymenobacter gummosus TaxID=1776032 RepID=A0A3S0ISI2_9BACT|nr:TonB-dependent receptor [Hymenobacter gummosus]RTQ53776.1 TonB-dependent receptor [Hymenobacter gummosus]